MTDRPSDPLETYFESTGSLPRPGWIGRIVRLALGVWLLSGLYMLVRYGWGVLVDLTPPTNWTWWVFMALGFWLLPPVVNIGFTKSWRRKPQLALAAALAGAVVVDSLVYGTWWGPPLGVLVWFWLVYFSAHLGGSFLLSAVIATPGCEMRAMPHLWTRVTGRATKEHYCPGFIDVIDRWEQERIG
jgi:hypothetical protein